MGRIRKQFLGGRWYVGKPLKWLESVASAEGNVVLHGENEYWTVNGVGGPWVALPADSVKNSPTAGGTPILSTYFRIARIIGIWSKEEFLETLSTQ
jgi:hypothetical protein